MARFGRIRNSLHHSGDTDGQRPFPNGGGARPAGQRRPVRDRQVPARAQIGADLGAGVSQTQRALTLFFVAFGAAQLVDGPLADRFGRKPPLHAGLAIFVAGSLGCALAPDIGWLAAARFAQGLGGAALMVIPRAIVRDMLTGPQATRLMAAIMLVIGVSPMLAPLAGSGIIALSGWRSIFAVLAVLGALGLALSVAAQPETLPPARRAAVDLRSLLRGARTLLGEPVFMGRCSWAGVHGPVFMGLTFIGGFGMASFFVFLASASFVYTGQYGLSPTGFSLAFALNAVGFFAASQMAAPLGERIGLRRTLLRATGGFALFTCTLLALVLAGVGSLPLVVALLLAGNACLGLVIPTTMVLALDAHGAIAGLASSLGGTLQMLAGGLMITAAGPFFDGTATPMVAAIALCGVLTAALTVWLYARPAMRPAA
ncbi:multidrug effflux MFS transporter [Halovulum marinum]|uniref:multidrug effflux MFS transporter n=1 Tax=Halovulum marinum TaxID=2662447 RepID=UPI002D78B6AD|nr:multidrug effflux MFS transporter [Halovulum marinum]